MVKKKLGAESDRSPKDLRYREQCFPGAESVVFETAKKGFVPLPIVLRKGLRVLSAAELRVLVYLMTRASKYGICYPSLEEIAYDLGMNGRKNLTPHLRKLEEKHFIKTHTASGKKFFLIHDPRIALERLAKGGQVNQDQLFEINELLRDLNREPVSIGPAKVK
jgi:helix-turn-helix protein